MEQSPTDFLNFTAISGPTATDNRGKYVLEEKRNFYSLTRTLWGEGGCGVWAREGNEGNRDGDGRESKLELNITIFMATLF